jgi:long-chain acyl-CoA synthetase
VADCAVLGVPHELLGEVPKAFVQLEPDYRPGPEMTLALLQYLGSRISPAKVPKRIEYLAGIPRDPNGKLYKRLLRERIAQ